MANHGDIDGEPQRIFNYGNFHPNLIRVDEAIFENRTHAFTKKMDIKLNGLESLKDTNYYVDYLRGSKWSKSKLEPLVSQNKLAAVNSIEQGFRKLICGRTDILISLEIYAYSALKKEEFKNSGIISLSVVGTNLSYPYLHKSHSNIAIKLAEIIRELKKSGRYNQILKETIPFMFSQ